MASKAKRVTLIVGIVALIAVIAGAVMAPELTAAPQPKTDFTIRISGTVGEWVGDSRTWRAQGAITGSGGNFYELPEGLKLTSPEPGEFYRSWMLIEGGYGEPFTIVEATGIYAYAFGATGTSTYKWSVHLNHLTGSYVYRESHVLKGSILTQ